MQSSQATITTTILDWEAWVDRMLTNKSTLGRGWGHYPPHKCRRCGYSWQPVEVIGSRGWMCVNCGAESKYFVWQGPYDPVKTDGCWLDPIGPEHAKLILN